MKEPTSLSDKIAVAVTASTSRKTFSCSCCEPVRMQQL